MNFKKSMSSSKVSKKNYKMEMVQQVLEKFPNATTRGIARYLMALYPLDFTDYENTRANVRYMRGERKDRKPAETVAERTEQQKKEAMIKFQIPDSDYKEVEPFVMPILNNRILLLTDIHLPYHDEKALDTALTWGKGKNPNAIILNGDTIDMYQASRYIKDRRLRDLAGELEMTREFLKQLKEEFDCPIYFKIGNHEARWENYLKSVAPELLGIADFELKNVLRFGELGVMEIKSTQIIKVGKLNVMHGHEFGHSVFSPVNAARGLYMRAKANSMIGHHHQTSEHSEKDLNGDVVTTWSVGTLAGLSPEYMPFNKWNHGFAWIDLNRDETFEVRNMRIINGKIC